MESPSTFWHSLKIYPHPYHTHHCFLPSSINTHCLPLHSSTTTEGSLLLFKPNPSLWALDFIPSCLFGKYFSIDYLFSSLPHPLSWFFVSAVAFKYTKARSANVFCKGPNNKYFRLFRPYIVIEII